MTSKRSFVKATAGLIASSLLATRKAVGATWQSLTGGSGSSGLVLGLMVSTSRNDYNMKTEALAAGWNGTAPITLTVLVYPTAVISASSPSVYAVDTDTGWPVGSTLALINNGSILGKGGAGSSTGAGNPGGNALRAQFALSVTNNGTIAGGGGGGGYAAGGAGNGAGGNGAGPGANTSGGAAYYYSYECL